MTGVIDYGMGNIGSLVNMIERLGENTEVISDPGKLLSSERLILPGVGSFDNGVSRLKEKGLWEALNIRVLNDRIPVLCICLGMQLIMEKSEEGQEKGLGWIEGECLRFPSGDPSLKVPHMGWNVLNLLKGSSLNSYINERSRFYFVHSYYVRCRNISDVLATTEYGLSFASVIMKDNIVATQFHPEKSLKHGMSLIKGFIEKC